MGRSIASLQTVLGFVVALIATLVAAPAAAEPETDIGFHAGINFDIDDLFIGFESRFSAYQVSPTVDFQINPTFSLYFVDEFGGLFNVSVNTPFEFEIQNSVLRPFAAPGLSIWHFSFGSFNNTEVALNLIGGLLFDLGTTEPFFELKVTVGGVDTAEILGGVQFTI